MSCCSRTRNVGSRRVHKITIRGVDISRDSLFGIADEMSSVSSNLFESEAVRARCDRLLHDEGVDLETSFNRSIIFVCIYVFIFIYLDEADHRDLGKATAIFNVISDEEVTAFILRITDGNHVDFLRHLLSGLSSVQLVRAIEEHYTPEDALVFEKTMKKILNSI